MHRGSNARDRAENNISPPPLARSKKRKSKASSSHTAQWLDAHSKSKGCSRTACLYSALWCDCCWVTGRYTSAFLFCACLCKRHTPCALVGALCGLRFARRTPHACEMQAAVHWLPSSYLPHLRSSPAFAFTLSLSPIAPELTSVQTRLSVTSLFVSHHSLRQTRRMSLFSFFCKVSAALTRSSLFAPPAHSPYERNPRRGTRVHASVLSSFSFLPPLQRHAPACVTALRALLFFVFFFLKVTGRKGGRDRRQGAQVRDRSPRTVSAAVLVIWRLLHALVPT